MNYTLIAGIIAASILLTGCEKKNTPPSNSPIPPVQAQATNPPPAPPPPPTDAELFHKVAGVWKFNNTNQVFDTVTENTFILATNGNFVKQTVTVSKSGRRSSTGTGSWQIKDGFLETTITKTDRLPTGAVGRDLKVGLDSGAFTTRNRIVEVNDFELVTEVDAIVIGLNGSHNTKKERKILTR